MKKEYSVFICLDGQEVADILASYGSGSGHVFNLGHGIHQHINPDHVACLVEAVHKQSKAYHTDK